MFARTWLRDTRGDMAEQAEVLDRLRHARTAADGLPEGATAMLRDHLARGIRERRRARQFCGRR